MKTQTLNMHLRVIMVYLSFIFVVRLVNQSERAEVADTINCFVNMNYILGFVAPKGACFEKE